MQVTNKIAQRKMHENAMEMIRRGLALIAIDPRTGTLPSKLNYDSPDEYDDYWMTASEVHEVIETLAEYVGEAPYNLFEGGRDCVNDDVVGSALTLASACTDKPFWSTVEDMQVLSEEVFCKVHMIEDPSEYAA